MNLCSSSSRLSLQRSEIWPKKSFFSRQKGQGSNPKNVQSRAEGVIIERSESLGCHSNRHDVLYLTNVFI